MTVEAIEIVTSPVDPVIETLKLVDEDAPGCFLSLDTPEYPARLLAEPSDYVEVKRSIKVVPLGIVILTK